jgi:para-nitrobenzyl esterase
VGSRFIVTTTRRGRDPGDGAGPGHGAAATGAAHSAEIEYALGNLKTNKVYAWTEEDFAVSATMESSLRTPSTENPGRAGGCRHRRAANGDKSVPVMRIDVKSGAMPEKYRARYRVSGPIGEVVTSSRRPVRFCEGRPAG